MSTWSLLPPPPARLTDTSSLLSGRDSAMTEAMMVLTWRCCDLSLRLFLDSFFFFSFIFEQIHKVTWEGVCRLARCSSGSLRLDTEDLQATILHMSFSWSFWLYGFFSYLLLVGCWRLYQIMCVLESIQILAKLCWENARKYRLVIVIIAGPARTK